MAIRVRGAARIIVMHIIIQYSLPNATCASVVIVRIAIARYATIELTKNPQIMLYLYGKIVHYGKVVGEKRKKSKKDRGAGREGKECERSAFNIVLKQRSKIRKNI